VEDLTHEKKQLILNQKLRRELEKRVEQRTAELRAANERLQRELASRQRMEDELLEIQDELEMRVQQRTSELVRANELLRKEINERKLVEERLRESEASYRDLVENANDIIYIHDLEGNYLSMNPAVERILGYTQEEALKLNFRDLVDPEFVAIAEENFRKKLEQSVERTGPYEVVGRAKNGDRVVFEVSSRILRRKGKAIGVHGTARDVTERKRAEQALRESEEKFRVIYEYSPIGIEIYNSEGKLLDVNNACLNIFGIPDAEAVRNFDLFKDPNLTEDIKEKLKNGEVVRYEGYFDFDKVKENNLYETSRSGRIYLDVLIKPIQNSIGLFASLA
jgi:PAS domain S-box-containing protein